LEKWMSICSVDVTLSNELEAWNEAVARADVLEQVEKLTVFSWLLEVEVVTGEAKDDQIRVINFSDECIHVEESVLVQTSEGGCVQYDQHLAGIV